MAANPYVAWLVETSGPPEATLARALAALGTMAARLQAEARVAAPELQTVLGGGELRVLEAAALALLAEAAAEALAESAHDRGRGALLAGALRWETLGRGAPAPAIGPDPTRAFAARLAAQSSAHDTGVLAALTLQGEALRHRARAIVAESLVPGFVAPAGPLDAAAAGATADAAAPVAARPTAAAPAPRPASRRIAVATLIAVAVLVAALAVLENQRERAWQSAASAIDSLAAVADAQSDTIGIIFDRPAQDDAEYRDDLRQGLRTLDRLDRTLDAMRHHADHALAMTLARGRERQRLEGERRVAELRAGQSRARRREAEITLRYPGRRHAKEDLELEQRMLESDVDALEAEAARIQRGLP